MKVEIHSGGGPCVALGIGITGPSCRTPVGNFTFIFFKFIDFGERQKEKHRFVVPLTDACIG